MRKVANSIHMVIYCSSMIILVLDTKTAIKGVSQGIELCISTIIPTLFPFVLMSILLCGSIMGSSLKWPRWVCKLLRLSQAGVSLFLTGLLGGYPTGAQNVAIAYNAKKLSRREACRLLSFCNNAGPSFLFGIGYSLFSRLDLCLLLWGIHILSALIVACLTPKEDEAISAIESNYSVSFPQALTKSLRTIAKICGWIVVFRVIIAFLEKWFLWSLPDTVGVLVYGILELAGGCTYLITIRNLGMRLILFSVFLGFGGVCVALQSRSVANGVDAKMYLPGKIVQAAVSFLLSTIAQFVLPVQDRYFPSPLFLLLAISICILYRIVVKIKQKNSGISVAAVV